MVTRSAATRKHDSRSRDIQVVRPRTDAPFTDSYSVNRNPATPMARTTRQQLIKVLLCDDDPADREFLGTCVQQITDSEIVLLQTKPTHQMEDALDKGRIDLILTDSHMPEKSRAAWLAEISEKQLAPVIMLTESGTEAVAFDTSQGGPVGYLARDSLSPGKLSNIINVVLGEWTRLQQANATGEKLERLTTLDPLTGLYNRQTILGKLPELINLADRYKEDFSLAMMDIDHLRRINDSYGHLIGDEVLEKVASLIHANIRDADMAGRYGGEEFVIILPKTNLASSWVPAERLRSVIENTEFKNSAANTFAVTVSQGLVGWERNDDAASLISRADEALCKAKEKGRNRVQILLGPSLREKV
jgi:two-component system cell cycle response regulator